MPVKKQPRVVFSFPTTSDAIRFEKTALEWKYSGRLIPVPREISAGCGLCWSAPPKHKEGLKRMAVRMNIRVEGVYELML
jgi:hypothetical protein